MREVGEEWLAGAIFHSLAFFATDNLFFAALCPRCRLGGNHLADHGTLLLQLEDNGGAAIDLGLELIQLYLQRFDLLHESALACLARPARCWCSILSMRLFNRSCCASGDSLLESRDWSAVT